MARPSMRRTVRVFLLSGCALTMVSLGAAIVAQSWQANVDSAAVVQKESAGATLLEPMTVLLGELVNAQSAAVRGDHVDVVGVRQALADVDQVDKQYGVILQSHQWLNDLTGQIEAALAGNDTGRAAYDTYSGLVALVVALNHKIADTSGLILDPDIDTYYLMDVAIFRLPDALVYAGRTADLVTLAGDQPLVGEDAVRVAVARYGVSEAADGVSAGIAKSLNATTRAALGTNLTQPLDAFRAASDAFAPPIMLAQFSVPVDISTLAVNARRVFTATMPLSKHVIAELQDLLADRAAHHAAAKRFTVGAAGLTGVAGLALLWLLTVVRPRERLAHDVSVTRAGKDDIAGSLTSASDLFDAEELIRIGRAVRTRPRRDGDAS